MWPAGFVAPCPSEDQEVTVVALGGTKHLATSVKPKSGLVEAMRCRDEVPDNSVPFFASCRWGHTLTPLQDGTALIFGGWDAKCQYNSLHRYDSSSGSLTEIVA